VGAAGGKGAGDAGSADSRQDGEGDELDEEERVPCEYPGCTKTFRICGTTQATIACHMKHHHGVGIAGLCLRAVRVHACCLHVCVWALRVCCACVAGMWVWRALMCCVCADADSLQQEDENGKDDMTPQDFDDDDDSTEADVLQAQVQAGSGAKADMQQQLAACLENASVIAVLKNKNKELAAALATKTRQLVATEQANIALHGVQVDKMKLEAKMEYKNNVINGLKLELATLRRKVVSYANATLGM
jgi:hypothetical protein